MHYVGVTDIKSDLAHQNAIRDKPPFRPASAHVEEDVISLGKMPPNKAYNLLNSNTGPGLAEVVPVPRSKAAVKYIQAKEKKALVKMRNRM